MAVPARRLHRIRRIATLAAAGFVVGAPSAHAFGDPLTVSPLDAPASSGAAVAGREGGGATVAWRRASDGAVVTRPVSVAGALGAAVIAGDTSTAEPPVAAAVPGGTMVAWVRPGDDHLVTRRVGNDGGLGPVYDVSGESLNMTNGVATVAANASGRVAIAWRRPSDSVVRVRIFDAGAGPSAPALDLSSAPDIALYGTNVGVAIDDAGEAAVVWHRNTDCHIIARRVSPAGTVGAQIDLSGEPDSAVGDTTPTVAVRPDGTVVGAWHRDSDHHAISRRWAPDGSTGPFVDLSAGDGVPSMASLVITPLADGDAVGWQRSSDGHVVTSTGSAAAAPLPLDASGAPSIGVSPPAIATTPDHALVLAWVGADGGARVAFSTGVSAPAPVATSSGTPEPTPTSAPAPTPTTTPAPNAGLHAGMGGSTLPETRLLAGPRSRVVARTVVLRVRSDAPGASFRCSFDGAAAQVCGARITLRRLTPGVHTVRVRAVDSAGNADPSPVVVRFRVVRRR